MLNVIKFTLINICNRMKYSNDGWMDGKSFENFSNKDNNLY